MNRLVLTLSKEFEKENNKLIGRLWKNKAHIDEILYSNYSKEYSGEEFIENYVGVLSNKNINVYYDLGEEEYDLEQLYILKQYEFGVSFHYFKMYDSEENINAIKLNIKKCLEIGIPFRLYMSDNEYDLNDPIYKFMLEEKSILENDLFQLYFCYSVKNNPFLNRYLLTEEIININIEEESYEDIDLGPFKLDIVGLRLIESKEEIEQFEEELKELDNENMFFVNIDLEGIETNLALYEIDKNYYVQITLLKNEVILNTIKFDGKQSIMYAKKVMKIIEQLSKRIGEIVIYLNKDNEITRRALEFYCKQNVTEFVEEKNGIRKYKSR